MASSLIHSFLSHILIFYSIFRKRLRLPCESLTLSCRYLIWALTHPQPWMIASYIYHSNENYTFLWFCNGICQLCCRTIDQHFGTPCPTWAISFCITSSLTHFSLGHQWKGCDWLVSGSQREKGWVYKRLQKTATPSWKHQLVNETWRGTDNTAVQKYLQSVNVMFSKHLECSVRVAWTSLVSRCRHLD